ncbi:MAG: ClpXP protease specificity-enhancing factor [Burkholderiales bacterium]
MNASESTSTRPYLIRALYEWCTDNGLTPYVAVLVDETTHVPREYVKNGEIVLNISFDATSALKLGNEFIEFKARFSGKAHEVLVPIGRVIAIYARENGQGMAFPQPAPPAAAPADEAQRPALLSSVAKPATPRPEGRLVQLVSSAGGPQEPSTPDGPAVVANGGAASASDAAPPSAPDTPSNASGSKGGRAKLKRIK